MRGPHVDAFPSLGIDPTAEDATAWKRECVYAIITDDCEFKIAIKWRGGYRLPIHTISPLATVLVKEYRAVSNYRIDLDQSDEKVGLETATRSAL